MKAKHPILNVQKAKPRSARRDNFDLQRFAGVLLLMRCMFDMLFGGEMEMARIVLKLLIGIVRLRRRNDRKIGALDNMLDITTGGCGTDKSWRLRDGSS